MRQMQVINSELQGAVDYVVASRTEVISPAHFVSYCCVANSAVQ